MKYIIKNNRLTLENFKCTSLKNLSDNELIGVAGKYQIGPHKMARREVEVQRGGITTTEERMVSERKPRAVLEDEVRKTLTITLDIPNTLWSDEQAHNWASQNLEEMKDISEINPAKREIGILFELQPYEEGLDSFTEMKRLAQLTAEQWDHFKGVYNFIEELKENAKTGLKERKRTKCARLSVHEYIPENREDLKELERMNSLKYLKTKAVEKSFKKYGAEIKD